MIPAVLYHSIYLIVITVLTISCIIRYSTYPEDRINHCDSKGKIISAFILFISIWIFIGFRPLSGVFIDMINYNRSYELRMNNDFSFDIDSTNFIFDNLLSFFASHLIEVTFFFSLIALIYFGCMFFSLSRIFPNDIFYASVIYLGAFSTFAYGTNGIKSGAAASIFLIAFAYFKRPLIVAIICLISLGFHHSMVLPIYALILSYFIKDPKWFFIGWLLCLSLSFFHFEFITDILSQFADEETNEQYILADEDSWSGKAGFRWDFILYSLPPILIGFWSIYKHGVSDRLYLLLLNTYLTVNGLWLLCMYIPFNNRVAYLSWFILPIVSIYPFLKLKLGTKQYIQLNYVVSIYLAFSLISQFIIK